MGARRGNPRAGSPRAALPARRRGGRRGARRLDLEGRRRLIPPAGPHLYATRAFAEGDEHAVLAGFRAAFGVERSLADWLWKFPPGERRIELALTPEGELLAHYAAVPVSFERREAGAPRRFLAGQVVDVFTGRKLGLFRAGPLTATIESFIERYCGEGKLEVLYGFPSRRAHALGRATGVYPAGADVPRFLGPVRRRDHRSTARRWLQYGYDATALDALWERCAPRFVLGIARDARFFRRRFLARPAVDYLQIGVRRGARVAAWAVLRLDAEPARFADLLWDGDDPADLEALLEAVEAEAARAGRETLELWLAGDPETSRWLAAHGIATAPHPDVRLVVRSFAPAIEHQTVAERLHLTLADSDLV